MAKSHRAGGKQQHGNSRAGYKAIAKTRSTTNSERRRLSSAERLIRKRYWRCPVVRPVGSAVLAWSKSARTRLLGCYRP